MLKGNPPKTCKKNEKRFLRTMYPIISHIGTAHIQAPTLMSDPSLLSRCQMPFIESKSNRNKAIVLNNLSLSLRNKLKAGMALTAHVDYVGLSYDNLDFCNTIRYQTQNFGF